MRITRSRVIALNIINHYDIHIGTVVFRYYLGPVLDSGAARGFMLVSHCGEYASECAYEWQSLKLRNIRRVFVSVGNKFGTFTSHSPPPYEDRSI